MLRESGKKRPNDENLSSSLTWLLEGGAGTAPGNVSIMLRDVFQTKFCKGQGSRKKY
jgi:hypothetical protein